MDWHGADSPEVEVILPHIYNFLHIYPSITMQMIDFNAW
jgi:hypothetical protein